MTIRYTVVSLLALSLLVQALPEDAVSSTGPVSSTSIPSSTSKSPPMSTSSKPSPSGPLNYYQQLAHVPSYNHRSPLPLSGSFSSLMNNLIGPFTGKMSRRAGGKLFSLSDQFAANAAMAAAAAAASPMSLTGGSEFTSGSGGSSVGSLEALNEAVNNVMMGINGLQSNPAAAAQANQLAGQLGSYLAGSMDSAKNGKKLLDIPKQWYKTLGDKLTGASEAAYTATVPLKETFMHTLKSFYSYIKPSRSQSSSIPSTLADNMMAAAAAAAAASPDSLLHGAGGGQVPSSVSNPKRRQSDSYGAYYYNTVGSKPQQQQQQPYPYGPKPMHPIPVTRSQQPMPSTGQQQQQRKPMMTEMMAESQTRPTISKQGYPGHPAPSPAKISNPHQDPTKQYDQMLNQMIQAQFQQSQQSPMMMPMAAPNVNKQPNALYQKSKEILSRFTKKRVPAGPLYGQNAVTAIPAMADYLQNYQRLPPQTVNKVANKLPTLPLVYNQLLHPRPPVHQHHQNQQRQQQQQQQSSVPKKYYTQPAASHQLSPAIPFQMTYDHHQQQQQQPQQQQQATSSSTISPMMMMSTSTSVSMSVHQSVSHENKDDQNGQVSSSYNGQEPNVNGISVQNNQGSVMYYYDTQSMRHQQDQSSIDQSQSSAIPEPVHHHHQQQQASPDHQQGAQEKRK